MSSSQPEPNSVLVSGIGVRVTVLDGVAGVNFSGEVESSAGVKMASVPEFKRDR